MLVRKLHTTGVMNRAGTRIITLLLCLAAGAIMRSTAVDADEPAPSERLTVRSLTYQYDEGAIFALPGEKIPLAVNAPRTRFHSVDAQQGGLTTIGPNRWTWEAPARPGVYEMKVKDPAGATIADFSAFVMVPAAAVRNGVLNNYRIGFYPDTPLKGDPIYVPPKGFIEVTRENQDEKVSENFRIKQFVAKQESGFPKYVVLDERLVFLLEAIGRHLESRGWDADDIVVMSGYRTPFYNKLLDDTAYSLHQWGRAADIFLDKDGNGRMDDLNKDHVVSKQDAIELAQLLESLATTAELSGFIGGVGIYDSTPAHGPFVHVDTRPWRARW